MVGAQSRIGWRNAGSGGCGGCLHIAWIGKIRESCSWRENKIMGRHRQYRSAEFLCSNLDKYKSTRKPHSAGPVSPTMRRYAKKIVNGNSDVNGSELQRHEDSDMRILHCSASCVEIVHSMSVEIGSPWSDVTAITLQYRAWPVAFFRGLTNRTRVQDGTMCESLLACEWTAKGYNLPDSLVKDTLQVSLREGRTFQILVCTNLLGHREGLFVRYRLHSLLPQGFHRSSVFSQIQLRAHQNDGNVGRMMLNLGEPFRFHIVERRRTDDRKTNQKNICLRIR